MADMTAQGVDIGNAFTAAARKSEAYNALSKAYGPAVADNPEQAQAAASAAATIPLAAQNAQTAAATGQANLANTQAELPIKQAQGQNLGVAAKSAQNSLDITAGLRGLKMMQAIANPDGSIPADEARHIASNPIYGIDQNHIEPLIQKLSQPGGTQTLGSMAQALQAGGKVSGPATVVTNPDGTTSIYRSTVNGGEVENNIGGAQTAQQQGIPIKQGTLQERIAQDAKLIQLGYTRAQIQAYNAGRGANNSAYGAAPGTSLPGDNRPSADFGGGNTLPKPSTDLIGAGNPPGSKPAAPVVPPLTGKPLATRTGAAQMVSDANANYDTAKQVINNLQQQAGTYTTGAGSWLSWLRGSGAANLRANTEALRGQVGSAIVSNMKNAQGQMGFRMSNAEFNVLTSSLGALGTEQSPAQFRQHLGYIANALSKFNTTVNGGFKTQYQTDPYSALGIPNPSTQKPNVNVSPQDAVDELRRRGVVK